MTAIKAPESAAARTADPGQGTLLVLLSGLFITTLDFFIVNVAIPAIQIDLHATPSQIQFIVAGFGLALAAGLITAGRLGDLYGRRRMFAIGLAAFTVASLLCGAAPTAGMLIAARVVQGLGAALLMPQVLAIINTVYTGESRAKAFNAYGVTMGFGGVFGQLIGGLLINADVAGLGWRTIFLINVPVGAIALALVPRMVPESRLPGGGPRLDLAGTVLVSLGLVAIVFPLVQGREQGWPLWTWVCLAAAVVLLTSFALHQRRVAAPLVSPELFRNRSFSVGMVVSLLHAMTMGSFFLILALYLQQGRGLDAMGSGLIFLPLGIGYFASSTQAAKLAARLGRQVVTVGALVMALGYGMLALSATGLGDHGPVAWIIPGLVVAGAGMGLVMAPLPALVLSGVDPRHAASAAGVLSTSQQAGGAIGVAVVGLVFYGALGSYPHAFALGLLLLIALDVIVAALVQALPRTNR
ncbi:DHA2 family efflux MFS transporter permease subunit [Nonomuraea sp. NPDC050536]|uniref:DHA2 family efflux MFS transporter permease subunit n=1 Tax=Nonomuraea sp. NPDC050536 TaxID=3364366 RepID=UPI0037C70D8A